MAQLDPQIAQVIFEVAQQLRQVGDAFRKQPATAGGAETVGDLQDALLPVGAVVGQLQELGQPVAVQTAPRRALQLAHARSQQFPIGDQGGRSIVPVLEGEFLEHALTEAVNGVDRRLIVAVECGLVDSTVFRVLLQSRFQGGDAADPSARRSPSRCK